MRHAIYCEIVPVGGKKNIVDVIRLKAGTSTY